VTSAHLTSLLSDIIMTLIPSLWRQLSLSLSLWHHLFDIISRSHRISDITPSLTAPFEKTLVLKSLLRDPPSDIVIFPASSFRHQLWHHPHLCNTTLLASYFIFLTSPFWHHITLLASYFWQHFWQHPSDLISLTSSRWYHLSGIVISYFWHHLSETIPLKAPFWHHLASFHFFLSSFRPSSATTSSALCGSYIWSLPKGRDQRSIL
jgi:hypothetical protein